MNPASNNTNKTQKSAPSASNPLHPALRAVEPTVNASQNRAKSNMDDPRIAPNKYSTPNSQIDYGNVWDATKGYRGEGPAPPKNKTPKKLTTTHIASDEQKQCRGLRYFCYCKTTLTVPYRKYEPFYGPSRILP